MWINTVSPNYAVKDYAGMCLQFTQSVWGAPIRYATAWDSWQANPDKQTGDIPEVACLIWFSHWGTYGGITGNFGHVVTYVPGRGYLSSPGNGYGQEWLNNISQVEARFNCTYVGWTPSLNGLTVAENIPDPQPKKKDIDMRLIQAGERTYLIGKGYIAIAPDHEAVRVWEDLFGDIVPIYNGHDLNRATWGLSIPAGVLEELTNKYGKEFGVWSESRGYYVGHEDA
jgi:hypothetical protein